MYSDNNLFNMQWMSGNLNSIAPLVTIIGTALMWAISLGGFFMVMLPILRMVINGVVVVAPNFCDKIDEAHKTKLGFNTSEGGNQIIMITGSIMTMVLSAFPNFKEVSDFNKGVVDPKSFMVKGLAMMCIYVFIGVFTFKGYPAIVADKFTQTATGFLDMALNNVDPEAWIEKIPTNLARPDFSTDNATDIKGKNVNKLSKSLFSAITGNYSGMSKDSRVTLSQKVEEVVTELMDNDNLKDFIDTEKYKLSVETRVSAFKPNYTKGNEWPNGAHDSNENIYIFQIINPIEEKFDIGIAGDITGDYYMCILKFYEQADKKVKSNNIPHTLQIPTSAVKNVSTSESCWIAMPNGYFNLVDGSTIKINGHTGTVKKITGDSSMEYKISFTVTKTELTKDKGTAVTGLTVKGPNIGDAHQTEEIEWITSNTWKCIASGGNYEPWTPGELPKLIKK